MKNNTGLMVLVVILSLLVGGLGGFIIYDKVLSTDSGTNNDVADNGNNGTNNSQSNIDSENNLYNFGDDIILTSLSKVNYESIGFPDINGDFSQWKVLKDEGNYITLYYVGDELLFGKADKDDTIQAYNERKVLFTSNGINFGDEGEIRILNESDLLLLNCNFETLTCSDLDWIGGWTSYTANNYKYLLTSGKLKPISEDEGVLAFSSPIIKILKSNIK